MDSLPALVGRHANIGLSNADTFYVSMIGGDHNFKVAIEQSVQEAPQRTPLGPMTDPGMHAIGACDDAVQHLIDCPDHDACDRAARLVELPANSADEAVVVFQGALTGIDGVAFPETAIFPEARPVLLFLARRVEALPKKNGGSPAKIDWRDTDVRVGTQAKAPNSSVTHFRCGIS